MGKSGRNSTSDVLTVETVRGQFPVTHWTIVLKAGSVDSPAASEAMAKLCASYWYPLYVYIRRKGHSAHDAEDLTQDFFAHLLAKNCLSIADRKKGKFRSFLLGSLEHFLARKWTRSHAKKRGAGQTLLSLDALRAENDYLSETAVELSPEQSFDRRWALTVLDRAMIRLRADYASNGRQKLLQRAECLLAGGNLGASYADVAASLEMKEGALKTAVHRLRCDYGDCIRSEVAHTVTTAEEVDEEVRYLFAVLRD